MKVVNPLEVDYIISEIRKKLDYQKYLTPANYTEENEKFLKLYKEGRKYNPIYTYVNFDGEKTESMLRCIKNNNLDTQGAENILVNAINNIENEIKMYEFIGNDSLFSKYSNIVYGEPSLIFYDTAIDILKSDLNEENDNKKYSAYELESIIRKRLQSYGFSWKIIVTPQMASRVSVEPDTKEIYINQGKRFTSNDILRLQVHEIDTHVLRAENGRKREWNIFVSGTAGSLIHEEGLALYNEFIHGVQDSFALKLYCARFICCIHINKSFYELFDMLINLGCSEEIAIYVVPRIKRGLSDTSNPGGFIKDYVYFQGMCEVKDAIMKDESLYNKLYYGDISLNDIEDLEDQIAIAQRNSDIILPVNSEFSI